MGEGGVWESESPSSVTARSGVSTESTGGEPAIEPESRLSRRLKLSFASLSCLGGIVLGSGDGMEGIATVAVFFAIFGFVCVDRLKLFALPSVVAYAAMGLAALYCVGNFLEIEGASSRQIHVVAELLVFVQAILMLQEKTPRIYEQLGVFCLLQLIVAAVYNNAIQYGLLLVPIGIIGAWALSLLVVLRSSESLRQPEASRSIRCSAGSAKRSLESATGRLPWVVLITAAPAVVLVGAIFFYALPRTTNASRVGKSGTASVGFSDQVRLEQIGQMLQSNRLALRVQLKHRGRQRLYEVTGPLYLRGKVLDRYRSTQREGRPVALWAMASSSILEQRRELLREPGLPQASAERLFDAVDVRVSCEPMRSPSLFAIAPFYRPGHRQQIVQETDRWTITRRDETTPTFGWNFPKLTYQFTTHGLRSGAQTEWIARWPQTKPRRPPQGAAETVEAETVEAERRERSRRLKWEDHRHKFRDVLTAYDADAIPTAERLAIEAAETIPPDRRNPSRLARRFEQVLAQEGNFGYTLNLTADAVPGLDPIEQFLSVDRRGNCQYFASALVMMLRSQDIPARLVVGFKTDEYNEIGGYFVARERHAHAWVEALVDREDVPEKAAVGRQADQYWLRLDPTPGGGGTGEKEGGVDQVFDLAKNMWDDYVVEMDQRRQKKSLLSGGGMSPMSESYARLVGRLKAAVARIRAGQLGGGSLAGRQWFSWPAALAAIVLILIVFVLARARMPAWLRRKLVTRRPGEAAEPTLAFFAEALEQLRRLGYRRKAAETPAEFTTAASRQIAASRRLSLTEPLAVLTESFYRRRFGAGCRGETDATDGEASVQEALGELKRRIDQLAPRPTPHDASRADPPAEAADEVPHGRLTQSETST